MKIKLRYILIAATALLAGYAAGEGHSKQQQTLAAYQSPILIEAGYSDKLTLLLEERARKKEKQAEESYQRLSSQQSVKGDAEAYRSKK